MHIDQPITILIAAYNEQDVLVTLHSRLRKVLDELPQPAQVLYVDDGSRDHTWTIIESLLVTDARVSGLRLARNFGKEAALTAGLDQIDGAVIVLDADGQDPPELIPALIERANQGFDVVYGVRRRREGESVLKRATANVFYRTINWLSHTPVPRNTGDFRYISARVVAALKQLRERQRFMKGLFAWVGFRQSAFEYDRQPRIDGRSKFNYWRLWNFALEGITGFSTAPLRAATYIGVLTALVAFLMVGWILLRTLLWGDPVQGWPSMMAVMLFLGGVQLMALGIIGEYLGRLYMEAKQRPLYLITESVNFSAITKTQIGTANTIAAPTGVS